MRFLIIQLMVSGEIGMPSQTVTSRVEKGRRQEKEHVIIPLQIMVDSYARETTQKPQPVQNSFAQVCSNLKKKSIVFSQIYFQCYFQRNLLYAFINLLSRGCFLSKVK